MEGMREWILLYIYIVLFTGSKILLNKWVRINYIFDGRNERMNITYIYIVFTGSKILLNKWVRINYIL